MTPAQVAKYRQQRGARYTTWFKAEGSMGGEADLEDPYRRGLLDEDLDDDEYAVPAQFYSNHANALAAVKFEGIIPLNELIRSLNHKLQYVGEERADFDFRKVYATWSYRYQVVEDYGGFETDTIIAYEAAGLTTKRGRPKRHVSHRPEPNASKAI